MRAEAASPSAASNVGRVSGRGGLAVTAAKVYFILTGLVQQIVLKAVLGLDGYGALSSALHVPFRFEHQGTQIIFYDEPARS